MTEFTTFSVGAKVFCDLRSGKPRGTVVEVIKPGNGRDSSGIVKVKLSGTLGAYRKGEIITASTFEAVPVSMTLARRSGQFFTRVSTLYAFE